MLDATDLLHVYDSQLRTEAEVRGAASCERHGPLLWATYGRSRGFVTYRSLAGCEDRLDSLVAATRAYFEGRPAVTEVEWKTRGHDVAPGLPDILREREFESQDVESVMLGEAEAMAVDVALPPGVSVRRITAEADVRRMTAMQGEVFSDGRTDEDQVADLLHRVASDAESLELWVAEADGEVVCAGRLEPVPGTQVAGIWGGSTLRQWRVGGSTGRSPPNGPGRRCGAVTATCRATPPSTPGPSSNAPGSSRSPPRPRTSGTGRRPQSLDLRRG